MAAKGTAAKGTAPAPAVPEMFGFLENGNQTQDSFRLPLKAFADLIVRTAIAGSDYNSAIPTPSGMSLAMVEDGQNTKLALRLVDD